MKRFIASASIAASYLVPFSKSFAQELPKNIELCPESESQFNALCRLNFSSGFLGDLITLAFIGAVIVALFFLIYGGIRWIASGGDKAQVEGAREAITGAVIGLVIVFLSYFILNVLLQFFTGDGLGTLTLPTIRSAAE